MLKFKAGGANASISPATAPFGSIKGQPSYVSDTLSSIGTVGQPRHTSVRPIRRKSSFISSDNGYSKANVIFQNVSVPLAWPTDEYFGTRRKCREFTVQLLFRTDDGREIFSRVRENVNRSVTDVNFNELFVFPFQSPDFLIEIVVFCKRTDEFRSNPSFVHSLSRSLGHSKAYLKRAASSNTISASSRYYSNRDEIMNVMMNRSTKCHTDAIDSDYLENYRSPESMCALGSAKFRLRNALLSGKTHTYSLDSLVDRDDIQYDRWQYLPIYGNICTQLLVQPTSLGMPLAEGVLDVFLSENGALLQRTFCRLQGGQLSGLKADETIGDDSASKRSSFILPITRISTVESTALPSTLRLKYAGETNAGDSGSALLVCESRSAYLGWRNALALQIADSAVWGDFASSIRNPHGFALQLPCGEKTAPSLRVAGVIDGSQHHVNRRSRAPLTTDCFQATASASTKTAKNLDIDDVVATTNLTKISSIKAQRHVSSDSAISTRNNSELDDKSAAYKNSINSAFPIDCETIGHESKGESETEHSTLHNKAIIEKIDKLFKKKITEDSLINDDLHLLHLKINSEDDTVDRLNSNDEINSSIEALQDDKEKSSVNFFTAKQALTEPAKPGSQSQKPENEDRGMKPAEYPPKADNMNERYLISLEINKSDDTQIHRNLDSSPNNRLGMKNMEPQTDHLKRLYNSHSQSYESATQTRTFPKYTKNCRLTNNRTSATRSLSRSGQNTWKSTTVDSSNWTANGGQPQNQPEYLLQDEDLTAVRPSQQTNFILSNYQLHYGRERSPTMIDRRTPPPTSSSSSSSNHEMQIAQITFSSSGSSKTANPSRKNMPLPLTSSYASLGLRPALKATASFALGNQPSYESIYRSNNSHYDSYMPQNLPGILKKCPSVSFSGQPTHSSSRYGSRSAPRLIDVGSDWNTITATRPPYGRSIYDHYTPDDYVCRPYTDSSRYLSSCGRRSTYYDQTGRSTAGAVGRSSTRL